MHEIKPVSTRNHFMLLAQGALNVVGAALLLAVTNGKPEPIFWITAALAALSGLLTIACFRNRRHIPDLRASLLFFGNLLPVYALLAADLQHNSRLGVSWAPFLPHELSVLTIASLTPPVRWIGLLSIALVPFLAGAQYLALPPEAIALAVNRPLAGTLAFSSFAVVLYFYRLHAIETYRVSALREAELHLVRRYTNSILAIKDLANSPIQAITFDSELLKVKFPEASVIAARIQESTRKLHELNRVLDSQLPEQLHDDLSFDASAQLVAALKRPEE